MRASGNVFVPFLLEPFGALLIETRRETSAVPQIQRNAIAEHQRILAALRGGDAGQAREAMESAHDPDPDRPAGARPEAPARTRRIAGTHGGRPMTTEPRPAISGPVGLAALTAAYPPAREVDLAELAKEVAAGRRLVVLDDDPTGTQTIADLPVLTSWSVADLRWALRAARPPASSSSPTPAASSAADAADRNREVAAALHEAAPRRTGVAVRRSPAAATPRCAATSRWRPT